MRRKKIYILKTGSTFRSIKKKYGDFEDWIIKGLNVTPNNVSIINVAKNNLLPDLKNCAGIIITGSHAMVTDNKKWSVKIEKWIPKLIEKNIPVLGICYGHQLIAKALNGYVDYNREGEKIGTIQIKLTKEAENDFLFSKLPKKFFVNISHSQSVFSLPDDAKILAKDSNNFVYAYKIGDNVWGIQFHPEFDKNIMKEYLLKAINGNKNSEEKQKMFSTFNKLKETSEANNILKLFSDYIKLFL